MRNTTYKKRIKYLNILDAKHPNQNKTLPIGSVALSCGGGLDPPNSPSNKNKVRKES